MEINSALYDEMIAHLYGALPEEGCGLIAGQDGRAICVFPIENRLHSPVAYEMEPLLQIEAMLAIESEGWELSGIYHSHPTGPAVPSPSDLAQSYYPDARYVIVSFQDPARPVARSFFLQDEKVREDKLTIR